MLQKQKRWQFKEISLCVGSKSDIERRVPTKSIRELRNFHDCSSAIYCYDSESVTPSGQLSLNFLYNFDLAQRLQVLGLADQSKVESLSSASSQFFHSFSCLEQHETLLFTLLRLIIVIFISLKLPLSPSPRCLGRAATHILFLSLWYLEHRPNVRD